MSDTPSSEELMRQYDALEERLSLIGGKRRPPPPPDQPIDDAQFAGDNDPMEARVTKLETSLAHIEKEVSNFKWWMLGGVLTIVITVITTVVATGIGIQQMTVTTFEAAGRANATGTANPIIINVPPAAPAPAAAPATPPKAE